MQLEVVCQATLAFWWASSYIFQCTSPYMPQDVGANCRLGWEQPSPYVFTVHQVQMNVHVYYSASWFYYEHSDTYKWCKRLLRKRTWDWTCLTRSCAVSTVWCSKETVIPADFGRRDSRYRIIESHREDGLGLAPDSTCRILLIKE